MATVLYAVYDERSGEVVHVHGAAADAAASPDDILAVAGLSGRPHLAVIELPADAQQRPVRVVDGRVADAPDDASFAGAGIVVHEAGPSQSASGRQRSFHSRGRPSGRS